MLNSIFYFFISFFGLGLILLIVTFIVINIFQKKDDIKNNNGIFIIDIDLKNNRIKKSDLIKNDDKGIFKNRDLDFFQEGWMDINSFLSNLSEENKDKFLNAIDAIKTSRRYVKFLIKNETYRDDNYYLQWVVEFFENKNEIFASIAWSYVEKMPESLKLISKDELFKDNHKYKSFVAFNLKKKDPKYFQDFIIILFESLKNKIKKADFFVSKNIVILIVYGDNREEVDKKIKLVIKRFEKIKLSKNIATYCDAIGVVEGKNITDTKDLVKVINRIYFSLIKSLQLKSIFYFNAKNIFFNEYEEFKENYSILNKIIKSKNTSSKLIPIKNSTDNTTIATYIKPDFIYPINFWTEMIVKNKNILPNLEDEYFNDIVKSLKNLDQYLIDVNDYIILQNIDKIERLSSMIFIIKFVEKNNFHNLELIASTLRMKGIKFGIKIENISPEIITFIETILPHAIIVAESLLDLDDLRRILNLKQLFALCQKNPATLIFENPKEFKLAENVNINYYYKYSA